MFGSGAVVAHALLRLAPASTVVDRAQPLVVVTAWGAFGARCFWTLAATLVGATVALVIALVTMAPRARRREQVGLQVALAAAAAIGAAWAWPFVFSSDVYAYAAYGAMALHGLDPYAPVAASAHGPLYAAARWQWAGTYPVCVYGPAFIALAEFGVWATHGKGVAVALWALRVPEALAFVASILVVDKLVQERRPPRRFVAVAAYGLNPVALWTVAEGHNDALLLAFAGAGVLLAQRRALMGSALVGLSVALKATGAIYSAAAIVDAFAFAPTDRRHRVIFGAALGVGLAMTMTVVPLSRALEVVARGGRYAPTASLQTFIGLGPACLLAIWAAWYGARRLHTARRDGYTWFALAAWLILPNVYPWYTLWVLPAIVAGDGGIVVGALWAGTILSALRYLPDAVGPSDSLTRLTAGAALLPLLGAFAAPLLSRHKKATFAS